MSDFSTENFLSIRSRSLSSTSILSLKLYKIWRYTLFFACMPVCVYMCEFHCSRLYYAKLVENLISCLLHYKHRIEMDCFFVVVVVFLLLSWPIQVCVLCVNKLFNTENIHQTLKSYANCYSCLQYLPTKSTTPRRRKNVFHNPSISWITVFRIYFS